MDKVCLAWEQECLLFSSLPTSISSLRWVGLTCSFPFPMLSPLSLVGLMANDLVREEILEVIIILWHFSLKEGLYKLLFLFVCVYLCNTKWCFKELSDSGKRTSPIEKIPWNNCVEELNYLENGIQFSTLFRRDLGFCLFFFFLLVLLFFWLLFLVVMHICCILSFNLRYKLF